MILFFWRFLGQQRHHSLSVFIVLLWCFLCLFRIPNPFSSFPSFLWEKILAAAIAKASDTLCEHLGDLTVKCWVQQRSSWLSPLHCNCWVISVLGDQYQVSLFLRELVEVSSWKHLLILSATLSSSVKGWKRFRTNAVTGDFLVCYTRLWFCPQAWCSGGTKRALYLSILSCSSFPHTAVGVVLTLA